MGSRQIALLLLGVVVACLLGSLLGAVLVRPALPADLSSEMDESVAVRLLSLLEEVETALREVNTSENSLAPTRHMEGKSEPEELVTEELVDALEELRELVRTIATRTASMDRWMVPQGDYVPKNLAAVRRLRDLAIRVPEQPTSQHFCWTPSRVYVEYGRPDQVSSSGNKTVWEYLEPDSPVRLRFEFSDGVVVNVRTLEVNIHPGG